MAYHYSSYTTLCHFSDTYYRILNTHPPVEKRLSVPRVLCRNIIQIPCGHSNGKGNGGEHAATAAACYIYMLSYPKEQVRVEPLSPLPCKANCTPQPSFGQVMPSKDAQVGHSTSGCLPKDVGSEIFINSDTDFCSERSLQAGNTSQFTLYICDLQRASLYFLHAAPVLGKLVFPMSASGGYCMLLTGQTFVLACVL